MSLTSFAPGFAPAIAVLPFVSFVIALVAGKYLPKKGAIVGIVATAGSLLISLWAAAAVRIDGAHLEHELVSWTAVEPFELTFGILLDPLSTLMLVIVSLIALLVHVFSLGYMNAEGETGLPRYYAELGLFTASMLAFVFSSNLLMAFIFFELVGLCSYLLIGFWFREDAPASAAKKAFLVTRFGDYFFLVGLVGILATFGTSAFVGTGSFPEIAQTVAETGDASDLWIPGDLAADTWMTILALLVLGGVIGKSAQFPLHTWLPDAMEGPTTVSALIHAATMVAAGVYLVARMFGFYAISPTALGIMAFVGAFTALFAATMGVVKDDIKQVLAYSTISQYGYMMLGLGVGGYVAATFHLMNHAFFKALLFLGAGSVIIMMHHEQNMWKMGGLKDKAPVTYYTFLAGALALVGIIPFSGFWSKDEILYDALILGVEEPIFLVAYAMALLAVFFTGLYTFRMVLLTFHGEPRTDAADNPHLPGISVKIPLAVLGVLATVAGLVNMKPVATLANLDVEFLQSWLDRGFEMLSYSEYSTLVETVAGFETGYIASQEVTLIAAIVVKLTFAFGGIGVAWALYSGPEPERYVDRFGRPAEIIKHNYYLDEFQVWLATGVTQPIASAANRFDQMVIDGAVDSSSTVSLLSGERVRRIQTGLVTNYALLVSLCLVALLVAIGLLEGWFL